MQIEIDENRLLVLLKRAAEMGATSALEQLNEISPSIQLAKAVKTYGRGNVEKWIKDGKVRKEYKSRGRVELDRRELQEAASLTEYYTTK